MLWLKMNNIFVRQPYVQLFSYNKVYKRLEAQIWKIQSSIEFWKFFFVDYEAKISLFKSLQMNTMYLPRVLHVALMN